MDPAKLAAMVAAARVTAAKEVEDPNSSSRSDGKPALASVNTLLTNTSSGFSIESATAGKSEEESLATALGITTEEASQGESVASQPSTGQTSKDSTVPQLNSLSSQPTAMSSNSSTKLQDSAPVDITYPGLFELHEKIITLDKALQANHPDFHNLLSTIHRQLDKDVNLIHMLKPDQVSALFRGLKKHTQTTIVDETVKSAASGRNKGLKNIGLGDL